MSVCAGVCVCCFVLGVVFLFVLVVLSPFYCLLHNGNGIYWHAACSAKIGFAFQNGSLGVRAVGGNSI